jgi:hypothetical protein
MHGQLQLARTVSGMARTVSGQARLPPRTNDALGLRWFVVCPNAACRLHVARTVSHSANHIDVFDMTLPNGGAPCVFLCADELSDTAHAASKMSFAGKRALTMTATAAAAAARDRQPGVRWNSWSGAAVATAARNGSSTGAMMIPARGHGSKLLSHSASEAARLARQASDKAAAALPPAGSADTGIAQAAEEISAVHQLQQQLASVNAQLESVLATVRQVLKELVLGENPSVDLVAQLECELIGLSAEEAVSEIVYQVQDKLTAAAAAVAAVEQSVAVPPEGLGDPQVKVAAGDVACMPSSAAVGPATAVDHDPADWDGLVGQCQDLTKKLEAAVQDRDAALLRAQAVAAARNDLAQQVGPKQMKPSSLRFTGSSAVHPHHVIYSSAC